MAGVKGEKSKRANTEAEIGIIGGSGLYSMAGLTKTREITVKTPFGEPSDAIVLGMLEGKRVAFLARHARGHRILPGEINFRANVYAMKSLGAERIISVSAVGSLKEELRPGEFLVVDQFVDRTKNRVSTFLARGSWRTWDSTSQRAYRCLACWPMQACTAESRCTGEARMCASRDRNFRRWRRRTCTGSWDLK